jgi:hypothetical protein
MLSSKTRSIRYFTCVTFTVSYHLVFYYAVPNPGIEVDRLGLKIEERVWRVPPTLDATGKHLLFMNLEDLYVQLVFTICYSKTEFII